MTTLEKLTFAPDMVISRLLNGMWQVSGAHGHIDPRRAIPTMLAYHRDGLTTWDLADHYGPAEDFIGAFRQALQKELGPVALANSQAFTKWVPRPSRITREMVEEAIDLSRHRMKVETLDLIQFHWWEYEQKGYLDALKHMMDLQTEGKIRHLGLTNFDTLRLREISEAGIKIVSNQIQYSVIDRRPERFMTAYCQEKQIWLLPYGTLAGGLLSDAYLDQPEPTSRHLVTASLRKYKNMIDVWGGWALFQEMLQTLKRIAEKHHVSVANVAVRYILEKPLVAGVIAGVRLGESDHRADNRRVFSFQLSPDDHAAIETISTKANDLYQLIGDCGDEYRRR